MKSLIVSIALVSGIPVAPAATIDEMMQSLKIEDQLRNAYQECLKTAQDMMISQLQLESQTDKLGLAPNDEGWVALAAIYDEFYSAVCESSRPEIGVQIFADVYAENLSRTELDSLAEFYSSPLGRKTIALGVEANRRLQEFVNEQAATNGYEAQRTFEKRIQQFWLRRNAEEHKPSFQPTGLPVNRRKR
jgi:hypothetical protein